MASLRVIVSRERAWEYDDLVQHFANVAGCQVILDRRTAERRRGHNGYHGGDRRGGERRSSQPHTHGAAVLVIH